MWRVGTSWGESKTQQGYEGHPWVEGWYTDISIGRWFKIHEWRCCMAKYDGVPYFLIIFGFLMFRFGKYGYWDDFGPGSYFGQEVDVWARLPEIPKSKER